MSKFPRSSSPFAHRSFPSWRGATTFCTKDKPNHTTVINAFILMPVKRWTNRSFLTVRYFKVRPLSDKTIIWPKIIYQWIILLKIEIYSSAVSVKYATNCHRTGTQKVDVTVQIHRPLVHIFILWSIMLSTAEITFL